MTTERERGGNGAHYKSIFRGYGQSERRISSKDERTHERPGPKRS
jgi:hypothetical protein